MLDVNQVTLIGHLGRDPEVRNTQDGRKVVNATVATTSRWKGRDGQASEKTTWHKVVAFGFAADDLSGMAKGQRVAIFGSLSVRKYTDQAGAERTVVEVEARDVAAIERSPRQAAGGAAGRDDTPTDEIPF